MIRLCRWAKAVATTGTRAMAPPRTRSSATRMAASDASRCCRMVEATWWSTRSTNIVWATAVGWSSSSSGGNMPE
jgi:hypothetical protein